MGLREVPSSSPIVDQKRKKRHLPKKQKVISIFSKELQNFQNEIQKFQSLQKNFNIFKKTSSNKNIKFSKRP